MGLLYLAIILAIIIKVSNSPKVKNKGKSEPYKYIIIDEFQDTSPIRFELIKAIQRDPFRGIGKPEPLKGQLTGKWSRRVNKKDRLLYEIIDDTIVILQCKGHYSDK